jgi:excisionase family DNA binding protein
MMRDTSPNIGPLLKSLVDQLADAVALRLAEQLPKAAPADDLVDEPTMAQRLNVSQPTLQRMRSAREIPFVQMGRRIAYRPEQVLAALTQNQTQESR